MPQPHAPTPRPSGALRRRLSALRARLLASPLLLILAVVGVFLACDTSLDEGIDVVGTVVDAETGLPINGAAVTFYEQPGAGGTPSTSSAGQGVMTDGQFAILGMAAAYYTVEVSASGYATTQIPDVNLSLSGPSVVTMPPVALTRPLPVGTYRILLGWGTSPSDLDAHATGPDGSGGRFHVFFDNTTFTLGGTDAVTLDIDDVNGGGPETITVNALAIPATGTYRYSAQNFSAQDPTGAAGIHTSPTRVQVYSSAGLLRTYAAPAPTTANGGDDADTWRVFELNISPTLEVTFNDGCQTAPTPRAGLCSTGLSTAYFRATSPSDTGVFLTGGPGTPSLMKPATGDVRL